MKDGELPIPANYKSWTKFLSEIQRPDAKQVREIYVNPVGQKGTAEKGFPNGTVFVMENYSARAAADGTLMKGADGKLVKGDLLRVFVMGKDAGWGAGAPEGLKNGDWIYAAYLGDGKASADNTATCRGCHLPLANLSRRSTTPRLETHRSTPAVIQCHDRADRRGFRRQRVRRNADQRDPGRTRADGLPEQA